MKRKKEEIQNNVSEIKFCITAIIDLQGFSSHLEVGSYDLRTNIGKQAIMRLQFLEEALQLMIEEKKEFPDYYPEIVKVLRVNDAIYLCIDIDDIQKPPIGQIKGEGVCANNLSKFFTKDEMKDEDTFMNSYKRKISSNTDVLIKFVGLVARIYDFINRKESENFFPGAKGIISTGFRMPFFNKISGEEDAFSANFSFANAYISSEKYLKGTKFYLDDYIIELLSKNTFAKNIIKYSVFLNKEKVYDLFGKDDNTSSYEMSKPIEATLFRKQFIFREVYPQYLTYLQMIPILMPYLIGDKQPNLDNFLSKIVFNEIKTEKSLDYFLTRETKLNMYFSLEEPISIIPETIATGKSVTKEVFRKKQNMQYLESNYGKLSENEE